jgi:plasmid stabilization system protein ParE
LSNRARDDLVRLHAFLREKDALAAKRAVLAIRDAFAPLQYTPLIGRPIEALREFVIEFGASGYLALYRYDAADDTVVVLAIKHQLENDYR